MFKRLRRSLTLICTGGTVLVLALMAFSALRIPERQLRAGAEDAFGSNLSAVLGYLRGRSVVDHAWLAQTETSDGLLLVLRSGADSPLLYGAGEPRREALGDLALQTARDQYGFEAGTPTPGALQAEWVSFLLEYDGARYHTAVCTVPLNTGWVGLALFKSTAAEDAQILRLRLTFVGYVVAAALVLFAFSWLFTGLAIRPVEENRKRQTQFVSAASHEIRTPLAVIQASAGAIEGAPPDKVAQFARNIQGECERLSGLAGDLLMLAGAESRTWSMHFDEHEPETLLLSVAERFEPMAAQKRVRIEATLPDEALPTVRCDAIRIEQLLVVLTDNALRYTPEGGRVRLETGRRGRWVWLSVSDSGPGVPDSQKPYVFDRFYRGGDSARTERERYGLGLSIAQEIAGLHKGSLRVDDAPGGGARFTLRLPL